MKGKAIEQGFVAAGASAARAKLGMKCAVENAGWSMHCKTVEDVEQMVLSKYPVLRELEVPYEKGPSESLKHNWILSGAGDPIRSQHPERDDGDRMEVERVPFVPDDEPNGRQFE